MSSNKTVVFGLDGADFEMIDPWIDDGSLPTLATLIADGDRTELRSCVPATTPPAWTTLTTGMEPGTHGIFGFYRRQKDTYDVEPVSNDHVHARRLWEYLSMAGLRSIVINVPVTHPGQEIDGVLVPGYLAPDQPKTYPEGILDEVGMEEYRVYAESESDDVTEEQLFEEWLSLTDSRRELATRLVDQYEWDLLFLEFQKTDGAVHKFSDTEKIRSIFEQVDDCMADVLSAVGGDPNVFVLSDHGIGQEKDWSIALNTWLAEEGYAETTRGDRSDSGWLEWATDTEPEETNRTRLHSVTTVLGRVGLTKQRLERVLSAVGLYDFATQVAPDGFGDSLESEVIDRERSTAFYEGMGFSGVDVGIVLNDERFYDGGTVRQEEYESTRIELMQKLEALDGPDGPPFASVRRREQVYDGPQKHYAPDIVLEQSPRYVIGSRYPRGRTFISTEEDRIDHTRYGILVGSGPDVASSWNTTETPSIADVTPTLLHLLDLPVNARFDGSVLQEILTVDREPIQEVYDQIDRGRSVQSSERDEDALRQRLEAMGYMT
jgi:predicted AlkP superfamily phosphohydrolase/phosphomutase